MNDRELVDTLRERWRLLDGRVTAACQRAGRSRQEVTVVAVTKTVGVEVARLLSELGVMHLGENRPQELWKKAALLPANVHWHLIGRLQRNKIDRTLPLVDYIHSVDSVRLLEALEEEARRQEREAKVLLEVNTSGEASKQGFTPETVMEAAREFRHVRICGLMTMAALQDPEACRPSFVKLREVRARLRQILGKPHTVEHLSMGMSNDFEVAVEEGATMIRVGTVLFAGLP